MIIIPCAYQTESDHYFVSEPLEVKDSRHITLLRDVPKGAGFLLVLIKAH